MVLAIMFFSSQVLGTMVNGAPVPQAALAQRAQTSASSSSSGGDPLGSLISGLAPFAEDLLPMLARDVSAKAPQDPESHAKAVAELSSKLVNDPTARSKLAQIMATPPATPVRAPVPSTKVAARAPQSSGDPLAGLIGTLAPFAEDLLPMLA
jgi:hypothetical protein